MHITNFPMRFRYLFSHNLFLSIVLHTLKYSQWRIPSSPILQQLLRPIGSLRPKADFQFCHHGHLISFTFHTEKSFCIHVMIDVHMDSLSTIYGQRHTVRPIKTKQVIYKETPPWPSHLYHLFNTQAIRLMAF